ncbi:hypothetical protein AQUCO_00900475v1 [Aquilegia coerulea]|uniref:H15 domain-containing protein n=1 Tax=Aquilegia coerulea TaxID=218851 RepID=A0A2G5EDU3_AQUCA|nr:hypothetical protein AQUCO_00900475v1 [Aquilegia coerulea]
MATTEEPIPAIEQIETDPTPTEPVVKKPEEKPEEKPVKMINDTIVSLKERTGSSQYAISKFIDDKHKFNLPPNFKKLLLFQIKKLVAAGKLVKVKGSFKVAVKSKTVVKPKTVAKPKIIKWFHAG